MAGGIITKKSAPAGHTDLYYFFHSGFYFYLYQGETIT